MKAAQIPSGCFYRGIFQRPRRALQRKRSRARCFTGAAPLTYQGGCFSGNKRIHKEWGYQSKDKTKTKGMQHVRGRATTERQGKNKRYASIRGEIKEGIKKGEEIKQMAEPTSKGSTKNQAQNNKQKAEQQPESRAIK